MQTKRSVLISTLILSALFFSPAATVAKSTLWKISSGNKRLYIQGSSHVLKQENYPLAPAIESAYSNSTALILEVDMAQMTSPQTQQLILGQAMLSPPATLQTVLTPRTYESLESACANVDLPIQAIQQFKPWFATMTLTMVKMQKLGFDAQYGLDKHFYEKAVADKKKVIGLETIDFQIALFDSLASENPDAFVNRTLTDLKLLETDIKTLLTAWENGDFQSLEKLMSQSFAEHPELYDKFVTARNKAWVQQLIPMLKDDETYMVVVGAGHLPGKEGVIKLLEAKGYNVEQL